MNLDRDTLLTVADAASAARSRVRPWGYEEDDGHDTARWAIDSAFEAFETYLRNLAGGDR